MFLLAACSELRTIGARGMPNPTHVRDGVLRLLKGAGPPLFFWSIGMLFAHHPMLFSRMQGVQIDHEDPRFINYLLEHGYQWLTGNRLHRELWNPPFFYPATNALAF